MDSSVRTLTAEGLPCGFFLPAFHRRRSFALPHLRRLFVEFAPMDFGEYTGLFTGPFESPHSDIEWLIFSDAHVWHTLVESLLLGVNLSRDRKI